MTRIVMLKSAELDFKELCHDFKARPLRPVMARQPVRHSGPPSKPC